MLDDQIALAELFLRLILGILFFFQAYDKLFRLKMEAVVNAFMIDAEDRRIPRSLIAFVLYLSSLIEFFSSILLILGLWTNSAIIGLCLDLVMISFAFSFMQPVWNMKHVFPRIVLLVILILLPPHIRTFSLDHLLK